MTKVHCHRCGRPLAEGTLKYQVAVRVRSTFDGLIADSPETDNQDLAGMLAEASRLSEEDLNRQVYEDDVFVMCPSCKEAFLEDIYAHIHPKASPEHGRAHLIH